MNGFVLHPQAIKDLEEVWEYIAADNLDAADRIREDLRRYPVVGSVSPCWPQPTGSDSRPLRFQVVRDYVIAYAPEEKPLAVIAVLHGRRNPRVIAAILRART